MTIQQYQERRNNILPWLNNAIRNKCYRTARARLRELARLTNEFNGSDYKETYLKLQYAYHLTDKIVI